MKLRIIGFMGAYPSSTSASSLYLIEKDGFNLALDFGSGGLMKLQNHLDIKDLSAVVLSHYHTDHVADLGVLQHLKLVQAQLGLSKEVLAIYGHQADLTQFNSLTSDYTQGIAYDPDKTLELGPFKIDFFLTKHSVPCYGMRISDEKKTLVYTGDSAFDEGWINFSKQADLLLADCNFYAHQTIDAGHMTSHEVAKIAEAASVKELILTHLPHYGNHADLLSEAKEIYTGSVKLAEEGLVWK